MTTHMSHTVLFSTHVAILCAFPLVYVHGVDGASWRNIASLALPIDEVYGASVGALLGAWLGAVPVPLDW
jgi:phosphatidylinositol glycan class F